MQVDGGSCVQELVHVLWCANRILPTPDTFTSSQLSAVACLSGLHGSRGVCCRTCCSLSPCQGGGAC